MFPVRYTDHLHAPPDLQRRLGSKNQRPKRVETRLRRHFPADPEATTIPRVPPNPHPGESRIGFKLRAYQVGVLPGDPQTAGLARRR